MLNWPSNTSLAAKKFETSNPFCLRHQTIQPEHNHVVEPQVLRSLC